MANQVVQFLREMFQNVGGHTYDNVANMCKPYKGMQQNILETNKFAVLCFIIVYIVNYTYKWLGPL